MRSFILFMAVPIGALILLVVLSFTCISVYLSGMQQPAVHLVQSLIEYIHKAEQRGETIASEEMVRHLSEMADLRVTLFSGEGNLLIDSNKAGARAPDFYPAANIINTETGVISYSISLNGNQYDLNEFFSIESGAASGNSYILCVTIPLKSYGELLFVQKAIILAGSVLLVLAALFYMLWRKSSKPKAVAVTEPSNGLIHKINQIELYANKRISLLSTALSNMDSGIILFGTDCSILMMNPKARLLTGAKSSLFFPDRPNPEAEYPPILTEILEMVRSSIKLKKTFTQDLPIEDGKVLSIHTDIIFSKYVPYTFYGVHTYITDVTEKRRMEKIRNEFVSNVSHELRTPLTLISGFAETLQNWRELDGEDFERAIAIIDVESKRLKHMISQLLDLSHIENRHGAAQKISLVDPIEAIKTVSSSLHALAEKHHIACDITLPSEKAEIFGDEASIIQIVTNLCENAIKYTPSGGNVMLTVRKEVQHLEILVKDNGIGIPEAEIPHIFDRFYRVEKSRNTKYGGSGLGLSITKALIEDLGGTIVVKSHLHAGSTFSVRLPLLSANQLEKKAT